MGCVNYSADKLLSEDFEVRNFCYGESILSITSALKLVFCEVYWFSSEIDFYHGLIEVLDETL